jgi:phenylalanyl-tRNA synthetase beta chain
MEYSLYTLNQLSQLNQLTINEIIDKLNLIGFEVDDIFTEEIEKNNKLKNIRFLIKIPSNRDDLLVEHFFLNELKTIFLFSLYERWKKVKENYFFLLKQNYLKYKNYETLHIDSNLPSILVYSIEIKNFNKHFKLPNWIKKKLENGGLTTQSKTSITNLLNLVTLEWGQSLNEAASLNLKVDKKLKLERLFEQSIHYKNDEKFYLEKGTIVLKDENNKIFNALGIFDSFLNNEIGEENHSADLLITGIFYDIEKNPLNLSTINTKISLRFLRKSYLETLKIAFQRLLTLIEILNLGEISIKKYVKKDKAFILKHKYILRLRKKTLKNVLNFENYDKKIFERANLKLVCETKKDFYFQIPKTRKDLQREIDLIEEYSRFIGYKNFIELAPVKNLTYSKNTEESTEYIKTFFLNYGFTEILTNSINDLKTQKRNSILIKNPLNNELSILRSDIISQIVRIFDNNSKLGFAKNYFEIGRVFKNSNQKIIEQDKLAGIFTFPFTKQTKQLSLEWFISKGFLENLLRIFGYNNLSVEPFYLENSVYHPKRSILIKKDEKILGKFGEINPQIEGIVNLKCPIYIFEFNLHHFKKWRMISEIKTIQEYSRYPSIRKDLSFVISKKESFSNLKKIIEENCQDLINLEFFDIYYDSSNISENINLGLRFEFQSKIKTLKNEFIEEEIKKIKELLILKFNVQFID